MGHRTMRQPHTLWPIENEFNERKVNDAGLPMWAVTDDKAAPVNYTPWWLLLGLALLLPMIAGMALIPSSRLNMLLAILAVVDIVAIAVFYLRYVGRLQEKLACSERWNETVFERNDIPLWREDWSAARDAVLQLLNAGERDIHAYFSSHPAELRQLRSKVLIKDVNQAAMNRAGVTNKQALLGSLEALLPDTDETFLQWLVAFAVGDTIYRSETHITLAGDKTRDTLFSAALPRNKRDFANILVTDLDITAYKAAQARAAHAEAEIARATRMTMMGALSASIAHEVNSPLAAILVSSEAALLWLQRDPPFIEEAITAMQTVNQQACRAQKVIDKTRAYLNNAPATVSEHAVDKLVYDAIQLIKRELRALKASVLVNLPGDLPSVLADAVNIQQVLVNLILNAAQAMEGKTGPRDITITAAVEGSMMHVTVSDSGSGIDEDKLLAIFEPFYSTKHDGMGMGLAICRTCIGAHGGHLWVTNNTLSGAQFHFTLPIAQ
ncbi:sensor histidine kinase [Shewanella dokdonensis]|uniref:histidine kinase n=1 Tax=Shewanella dokdonensis TaxID=712036 RepID=A0ABX8DIE6_9GAMM|nr:ATP-binding protein [Shewanella dokdonensis]MCL1075540.1 ATP-binding protein [Shewanella dokdonensis]QVK24563.1 hypothetical protein KHX94_09065 [Shewanella dokdonensis]